MADEQPARSRRLAALTSVPSDRVDGRLVIDPREAVTVALLLAVPGMAEAIRRGLLATTTTGS